MRYNHIESVYWVFTQLCNDQCAHCYNLSGPQGARISEDDCLAIIQNLPDCIDRLILSGGEPIAEKKKLYLILDALRERYGHLPAQDQPQIILQTNGDLLTGEILDTLIEKGISRFDIAGIDRFHKNAGARLMTLADVLTRVAELPIFQALDKGDPYSMGETIGVTTEYAHKRCGELGNVCLWCDEFFTTYYDIKTQSVIEPVLAD